MHILVVKKVYIVEGKALDKRTVVNPGTAITYSDPSTSQYIFISLVEAPFFWSPRSCISAGPPLTPALIIDQEAYVA